MSPKTHLISNPFFCVHCKINVDSYAETWIIYSTLILQKNTAEPEIPTKIISNQPTSRNLVATENRSRDLELLVQLFHGHNITKTSE